MSAMRPPMFAGPMLRQVNEASVAESSGVARFCAGRVGAAIRRPVASVARAIGRCAFIMRRGALFESNEDMGACAVSGERRTSPDVASRERQEYVNSLYSVGTGGAA